MSFTTRVETRQVSLSFVGEPLLTEQTHAEHCDVHNIMKRFERTQLLDHANAYAGEYADYIDGLDFHTAMNQIAEAESMFESIPSKIRAEFGNDPARFLTWIQDEKNRDEISEKGFSTSHFPPIPSNTSIEAPDELLNVAPSDLKAPTKNAASAKSEPVKDAE